MASEDTVIEAQAAPDPQTALYAALARAQGRMPDVVAGRTGTAKGGRTYKYPALDDILPTARPILAEEGLTILPRYVDGGTLWLVAHKDGGSMEWFCPYAMQIGHPQDRGICQTYDRRYQYCGILGIAATEDDDAQSIPHGQATQKPTPARTPEQAVARAAQVPSQDAEMKDAMDAFWRAWAKSGLPSWKTDKDAARSACDEVIVRSLGERKYLNKLSASELRRVVAVLTPPDDPPSLLPSDEADPFAE